MTLHPLLQRQLRKCGLAADPQEPAWQALLERVSRSYDDIDDTRHTYDRTLAISSDEMALLRTQLEDQRDAAWRRFRWAPVGIFEADLAGTLVEVNPAVESMLGRCAADLRHHPLFDAVHPHAHAPLRAAFAALAAGDLPTSGGEYQMTPGDDSRWGHWSMARVHRDAGRDGVVGVVMDVSDRRRLQVELLHAQKLESVGRLAAGVAHEINTPIQFVGDNARFLRDGITGLLRVCEAYRAALADPSASTVSATLVEAVRAIEHDVEIDYLRAELPLAVDGALEGVGRIATIVQAMKVFAHPDGPAPQPSDLAQALRSTAAVATNELKYVARVAFELAPLPPVVCHLGDINQVVLNLLVNAAHAIATRHGADPDRGRIVIRAWAEPVHVVIAVSDNGTGIHPEHAHKVFDPFFTTKEVGKGTGQGLALAHAVVVDKHKGSLTFDTRVGEGTTFFVRLPIDGRAEATGTSAAPAP